METSSLLLLGGGLVLGIAAEHILRRFSILRSSKSLEEKTQQKVVEAESKAKEIVLEAKEKAASFIADFKKEERERVNQLSVLETRVLKREEMLDRRATGLTDQEKAVKTKQDSLAQDEEKIKAMREDIIKQLEHVSRLTESQAKDELVRDIEQKHEQELNQMILKLDKERHDEVEKRALDIITVALQRYARSHVAEITTTMFPIENEELKGKIIGREGRNIRALERATGVEFVIDEVPDAIVISSFDPYRREVARLALAKLVKDGRIQPAKIEEKVEEAKQELQKRIQEIGEQAVMEVGVYGFPKEIVQLIGRLHFRTSYGQNVLVHSIEMAHISGMIAAELGLNVELAKRAALVHDIGKAIDHEVEGTHVDLGRKILKKYGMDEAVIEGMQSHHEDYPYAVPEAYVVTAADVLSAARPGARRDSVENYVKRLGDLEKLALEFPGVKQAYAISAGRELRVFVVPEKIDDFRALELAREIANRIQSELKYPGEIKVNVIREMRAVEYAR
ncbi:MAG: ribonuclease Y [Candidatus Liptonbacteria bacterium]